MDQSLRDPRLARIVKRCQELPGEELGQDITAKDFRTWQGTRQILVELAQVAPAESETEAKRRVAAAVKATALHLGNRPATCRKYYIHPAVFECYSTNTVPAVFASAEAEPAALETAPEAGDRGCRGSLLLRSNL